jgi:peptidoglycan/xylan/chitin deacetylase (PgdA/CDA1 family)
VKSFAPGGEYIVLTFSNGPHHVLTPKILDILKQYDTKASFFVYGQRALHHPDIIKRIIHEGHDLGQQGFHPVSAPLSTFTYNRISKDRATSSIIQTTALLRNLTNSEVRYFRPPFGLISESIESSVLKELQLYNVMWSLDSHDRSALNKHGESNPEVVSDHILKNANPGEVVLFHDTQTILLEALPRVLQGLHDKGYEFLTLTDILKFPDDSPH